VLKFSEAAKEMAASGCTRFVESLQKAKFGRLDVEGKMIKVVGGI
jgi:hypothetical protein